MEMKMLIHLIERIARFGCYAIVATSVFHLSSIASTASKALHCATATQGTLHCNRTVHACTRLAPFNFILAAAAIMAKMANYTLLKPNGTLPADVGRGTVSTRLCTRVSHCVG